MVHMKLDGMGEHLGATVVAWHGVGCGGVGWCQPAKEAPRSLHARPPGILRGKFSVKWNLPPRPLIVPSRAAPPDVRAPPPPPSSSPCPMGSLDTGRCLSLPQVRSRENYCRWLRTKKVIAGWGFQKRVYIMEILCFRKGVVINTVVVSLQVSGVQYSKLTICLTKRLFFHLCSKQHLKLVSILWFLWLPTEGSTKEDFWIGLYLTLWQWTL